VNVIDSPSGAPGLARVDWVSGDSSKLPIPAHIDALREGGERFLTGALRSSGILSRDNQVTGITRCEEFSSGGTGRKAVLSVSYLQPEPGLHRDLFVKFSRDFDEPMRDRNRHMLQSEVWFAALSQAPRFPVTVPKCYFADHHQHSGTGLLITQCIAFGHAPVEPFRGKCLDYRMPDALEHYRAIVRSLARLAGAHKAGKLPDLVEQRFPFKIDQALALDRFRYDARQLQNRVQRYAAFAADFPQLLPSNITNRDFIEQLNRDVVLFAEHEQQIRQSLYRDTGLIALCHWNANIDNAWFWRDADGELQCGLMDWGRVGQMNVAASLYGSLSGAEPELWNRHLDSLLALFADEFERCGAPAIDRAALKLHVHLFTALMGLAYIMDAPPIIRSKIPDLEAAGSYRDERFIRNEAARTQLHMITMLLNQWQTHRFGELPGVVLSA
jgi:hypothetical protein